jgi:hypothetical protein
MSLKSSLSKPIATWAALQQRRWRRNPVVTQQHVLKQLIKSARNTLFGRDHRFSSIRGYADFKACVPIRDYEGLSTYIHKIKAGVGNVLWPGKPLYLAETAGTTSGSKYIPITKESMPHHLRGARNALLNYIHETGKSSFVAQKMIFLSGESAARRYRRYSYR